ncbi:Secretory lipase [Williamsia sterculiae]|uniref:Secretory lipase n=2 Tax=Williamsia sterculiae TaxID=1344003 RepID=A0A1N7D2F4_9NOCA|nr:Secretory lipase [Williamsia sterculiae]
MRSAMSKWMTAGLAALVAIGMAVGPGVIEAPTASAEPAPPRDAFYDLPGGWASTAPGAILKSRPVNIRAAQLLPLNVRAWQLLYRSTAADGSPYAAVTTVMIPKGTVKPRPLLSYQAATDSVLRICNPSYALVTGSIVNTADPAGPVTFALPAAEIAFAAAGLQQGWAVAMPDHGGVDNRFLTPRQPGFAVLDGIRAVQHFQPVGLNSRVPVGLWGYSGGAIASSWTVEEQPTYAPEVNIQGAAFGAAERDLAGSLRAVNRTPLAGLVPLAFGAVLKDQPELDPVLAKYVTPQGRRIIAETRNHCLAQNVLSNLEFDYRPYLTKPLDVVLADPQVKAAFDSRGISGRHPTAPVYVYNGVTEEVSPIAGEDKLVQSYCSGGTPVTYRREQIPPRPVPELMTTHGVVAITGAPNAFAWLKTRLAPGASRPKGCDIQTVPTSLLTPQALATLGPSFIGNTLLAAIGQPLG